MSFAENAFKELSTPLATKSECKLPDACLKNPKKYRMEARASQSVKELRYPINPSIKQLTDFTIKGNL
ncbi:hypothetical protein L1887_10378 [Cichorium endivia]|nr:hypothetical protein L1887_10378 [Cichorium endivia]